MSLRSPALVLLALALGIAVLGTGPLVAQEEPLAAGSEGVPLPKKTKHVQPTYPQEAIAQGVRGIVILDLVVDAQGKVEATSVVRSVPGLDEAAIAAARQWEYTPTKVDGKPVRVRVTVPITFALALPQLARQDGVPELRQGVPPAWPGGAGAGGVASAEVTLEPDGRVGAARVLDGEGPWASSLLAALRTWRFAPPPDDAVMSFRVQAEFASEGSSPAQRKVTLKASGLQKSGFLDEPTPAPAAPPAPVAGTAPASPAPASPGPPQEPKAIAPPAPATAAPPATAPAVPTPAVPTPAAPTPAAPTDRAPTPASPVPQGPPQATPSAPALERQSPPVAKAPSSPPPSATAAGAKGAPPEEVLTAPPPAVAPENGVSAIRDVALEPGVPDLTRGRRPVVPPLARMAGTSGTVEVTFSVSAAGTTTVQSATGPDALRPAAEQAVASWVFRRARADRAYLVAVFTSEGDKGTALVRPQGSAAAPPASPAPAMPEAARPAPPPQP